MGVGGIIILLIFLASVGLGIYYAIKAYYKRQAQQKVYLCIDYFVRHLHDQAFYHPRRHNYFKEYSPLYYELKSDRHSWYYDDDAKRFIDRFIDAYEMMDGFIRMFSTYMGEDHYFSHSEYRQCKMVSNFRVLMPFIDGDFLSYVNKTVPDSLSSTGKYKEILGMSLSDLPQRHNLIFVHKELRDNKRFFDTVLDYPLDQQQRESIVKLEDNALVVSSAGSGKTSTSVGKIKYLVECRHIEPRRILPLAYARNAAAELTNRIGYKDRGLVCHTFHSLAFHILAKANQKKPNMCDEGLMLQCFYHQVKTNPEFLKSVNEFLTERNSLTKYQHEYRTAQAYVKDRALYGIQAPYLDMDNRIIFTRSEEEKKICTFLSNNNIQFRYEERYPIDTTTQFRRQYMPDFTIWFQRDGRQYFLILEHFGVDSNGNVPLWFGEGKSGGYNAANQEYQSGMNWKRQINAACKVPLLETTSAMFHDGTIYKRLTDQLNWYGVPMRPLTEEEKFDKLVVRNRRMEDSILQLIKTFITLMKSNRSSIDAIYKKIQDANRNNPLFVDRCRFMLYNLFKPVYEDYQMMLEEKDQVDYTDLILMATDLCKNGRYTEEYDYILVDEFQDISIDRFNLLQALRRKEPLTKLFCVGDDWQSIFRFSGSDLTLFSSFEDYFGFTERCKIETTYRFGNPLVGLSSAFILMNDQQVAKDIKPFNRSLQTEVTRHEYSDSGENSQWKTVLNIVHDIAANESIMFIARYHSDSDFIPNKNVVVDSKGHVTSVSIDGRTIPFNTVHGAKGLEADHVILVNCSQDGNGFPSKVSDDPILGYVLSQPETFPFAEERRLFYVAITRAKKHSYILYKDTCPSPFLADLFKDMNQRGVMVCPMCKQGTLRVIREGVTQFYNWRYYGCSNSTSGCLYTWLCKYMSENEIYTQYRALNP